VFEYGEIVSPHAWSPHGVASCCSPAVWSRLAEGSHVKPLFTWAYPRILHWDLSLFKTIRVSERVRVQLRAEAQDAFNHAMFAAPNTTPTSTLFGQVSSIVGTEQRRVQVGAKLSR